MNQTIQNYEPREIFQNIQWFCPPIDFPTKFGRNEKIITAVLWAKGSTHLPTMVNDYVSTSTRYCYVTHWLICICLCIILLILVANFPASQFLTNRSIKAPRKPAVRILFVGPGLNPRMPLAVVEHLYRVLVSTDFKRILLGSARAKLFWAEYLFYAIGSPQHFCLGLSVVHPQIK